MLGLDCRYPETEQSGTLRKLLQAKISNVFFKGMVLNSEAPIPTPMIFICFVSNQPSDQTMEAKKEVVICVYSVNTDYMLPCIERINKNKESPFYYMMYYIPVVDEEAICKCIAYVKEEGKDCVLSLSETSLYVCAIINERLGYPSPTPLTNGICQNKYQTRLFVSDFEWCYGFNLGDPVELVVQNVKTFPCILKPTMLCGGKGMFRCDDEVSLRSKLHDLNADKDIVENVQALQSQVFLCLVLKQKRAFNFWWRILLK